MHVISPGLSNESWSIMKNMATELGIILIGYFTLVPAIQVSVADQFEHTGQRLVVSTRM